MPEHSSSTLSSEELDEILSIQIAVAWAGESSEDSRLGWWDTDLISEYGGGDFFKELAPSSWKWLCFKAAREVARRKDNELRRRASQPDEVYTLYHFGYEIDEQLTQRLDELIHHQHPVETLLQKSHFYTSVPEEEDWAQEKFEAWLKGLVDATTNIESVGRVMSGPDREMPGQPLVRAKKLARALLPLSDEYPLPHYRRTK
jgi:hypothetical protein